MGLFHARLSPSSAHRWTSCTASPTAQEGLSDSTSEASRKGTTCHQIGAECLEAYLAGEERSASDYEGRVLQFYADRSEHWADAGTAPDEMPLHEVFVNDELIEITQSYIDFVIDLHRNVGGQMFIETRVPIGHITGEEGASGSSDCAIHSGDVFYSIDLKAGSGRVRAYDVLEPAGTDLFGEPTAPVLRMNLQLAMYALGGVESHNLYGKIKRVKAIIVQPALKATSEYECSIEELIELKEWLSGQADLTRTKPEFVPNNDNCFFCKARFTCEARNAEVVKSAIEGFDDVPLDGAALLDAGPKDVPTPKLGTYYAKLDMIRKWCDDIEDRVKSELESGRQVLRDDGVGYKLVEGRAGNAKWSDEQEAEVLLKQVLQKDDLIYQPKCIVSPTQAATMAKAKRAKRGEQQSSPLISAENWAAISELIERAPGKPTVAIETDPRPAINLDAGFDEVNEAGNSDLFN